MTAAPAAPAVDSDADRLAEPGAAGAATLYVSEAVVGGLIVLAALLAWVSLALADLGHHTLVNVVVGTVVAAVVVGVVLRLAGRGRVTLRVDTVGLVGCGVIAVFAAVLFLPGFHYGATDKDPGGYVAHAQQIARGGGTAFKDNAVRPGVDPPQLYTPGARWPAFWQQPGHPGTIYPQFYHLWPALLATADDVAGERGLANTGPLCGILAVLSIALALRRAVQAAPQISSQGRTETAGLIAGGLAGVLLTANMLEVWQAKYPTTEISTQMLYGGTLLALVIALATRWGAAAGVAGLLLGIGWLDRPDGFLLILLAAGVGAVLVAAGRWDHRCWWCLGGVAVVLPHALYQAYSPNAAKAYTLANSVPTLKTLTALIVGLFAVALVLRRFARPVGVTVARWAVTAGIQRWVGAAVVVLTIGLIALGFLRPRLFGPSYLQFSSGYQRSYDEQALARLSWFLSRPSFVLLVLGVAVVALRKWGPALWTLTIPTLVIFPVFAYKARNSTRLMWWSRRYVPTVLPGVIILVALALAVGCVLLAHRRGWLLRLPALAAAVALLIFFLGQSLPLRSHDEMGGTFAITTQLDKLAGAQQGVYLWPSEACCLHETQLFPAALWLAHDDVSVLLPPEQSARPGYVQSYVRGFHGQPVFLITHGTDQPGIAGVRTTLADRIVTQIPFWEESDLHRPSKEVHIPVNFSVWRVAGT